MFEFEANDGIAHVRGSNAVAMATGLNGYLKYHCHASVSWVGNQLALPSPLPDVAKTRRVCRVPWRYYFNYDPFGSDPSEREVNCLRQCMTESLAGVYTRNGPGVRGDSPLRSE